MWPMNGREQSYRDTTGYFKKDAAYWLQPVYYCLIYLLNIFLKHLGRILFIFYPPKKTVDILMLYNVIGLRAPF